MNGFVLIGFWLMLVVLLVFISWLLYLVDRIDVNFIVMFWMNGVFGLVSVNFMVYGLIFLIFVISLLRFMLVKYGNDIGYVLWNVLFGLSMCWNENMMLFVLNLCVGLKKLVVWNFILWCRWNVYILLLDDMFYFLVRLGLIFVLLCLNLMRWL